MQVTARVKLGRLNPDDVAVEIYHGRVDSAGNIENGQVQKMAYQQNVGTDGVSLFAGAIPCRISGRHGFALRIMPRHADLVEPYEPGLILCESTDHS